MSCKVEYAPNGLPMIEQAGEFRVLGRLVPPDDLCALPAWDEARPVLPADKWQEIDAGAAYSTRILDQGTQSSCVGHASCSGLELAWQMSGQPYQQFSPTFIYGLINGDRDNGAYIKDALTALKSYGICLEAEVPRGVIYRRQFPNSSFSTAKRFKLAEAFKCRNYDDICSALSLGYTVIAGVMVGVNFGDLDDEGIVPARPDRVMGGHAILLRGLVNTRKHGLIPLGQNSWSERWGDRGLFKLPRTYVDAIQLDAFVPIAVSDDPQDNSTDPPVARDF